MAERPILFNDAMVRAILSGAKTQTRRPVDASTSLIDGHPTGCKDFDALSLDSSCWVDKGPSPAGNPGPYLKAPNLDGERIHRVYPRIATGDTLWLRECFYCDDLRYPNAPIEEMQRDLYYRADGTCCDQIPECQCHDVGKVRWRPSILMPRWASRLTLRVTDVRVERVQDITEDDARAEGVHPLCGGYVPHEPHADSLHTEWSKTARQSFMDLWNLTYGPESWVANPWVWVVAFERVEVPRE